MAKKRATTELRKLAQASSEACRVARWNRTHAAMCVYGRVLEGFAERISQTKLVDHDDPDVLRELRRGHERWRNLTEFPPLDSVDNWRIVAVAAGAPDESLLAVEEGQRKRLDLLVERIAAYVKAKLSATKWSKPLSYTEAAKLYGVNERTIRRWIGDETIRVKKVGRQIMVHTDDLPTSNRP